jgi:hypothetical protein
LVPQTVPEAEVGTVTDKDFSRHGQGAFHFDLKIWMYRNKRMPVVRRVNDSSQMVADLHPLKRPAVRKGLPTGGLAARRGGRLGNFVKHHSVFALRNAIAASGNI